MRTETRRAVEIVASGALFLGFACVLWLGSRPVRLIFLPVLAVGYASLYIVQARAAKRRRPAK